MTTYQVFWAFPNQEASVKCTPAFVQYLTEGKQGDKFEGFEIKYRVLDPQNGTGNFIVEAESPQKIWEHTAPWIKGCLLYTSPSPRDKTVSRMPSSA